jgi:hypothetical protein
MIADKKIELVEIEFHLKRGFLGRFDFDKFVRESGLMAMLKGLNEEQEKDKRASIQRLYNELTKLWEEQGFIKFAGFRTIEGRRGRKFKIYEPCVDLTFRWHLRDENGDNH